jgi:hypothetical protein
MTNETVARVLADTLERRLCLSNAPGFVDTIDNPFMPLIPGSTLIYRGTDSDGHALLDRFTFTDETQVIAGVRTTVVRDRVYTDGKLTEDTRDFFAQDTSGNVWYFGEVTREFEDGELASTAGSFEAGKKGAAAGIIMKAFPAAGDDYFQENAPGVAEDRARVLALDGQSKTPFASFGDCLVTEETTALEPGTSERKLYAPGIGFVFSEAFDNGESNGEVLRLTDVRLAPQAFADAIDNPLLPMTPGVTFVYRGVDDDGSLMLDKVQVTHETRVVAGVTTTVVHDRVYVDGALSESTRDFFAQDKAGNVWYFGEDSKDVEAGKIVSREGSWQAGVNGAKAGIIMRARPGVGDEYPQERAPGVAEDRAQVLSLQESVAVPFGTFGNSVKIRESTPLEPGALEDKLYAPGIGFVMSQAVNSDGEPTAGELLRLVSIVFGT